MRTIRFLLLLPSFAAHAHPGHGKPGFNHPHTPLEYLLIDSTLVVAGLALFVLLAWAIRSRLRK